VAGGIAQVLNPIVRQSIVFQIPPLWPAHNTRLVPLHISLPMRQLNCCGKVQLPIEHEVSHAWLAQSRTATWPFKQLVATEPLQLPGVVTESHGAPEPVH
jgi:hypothetical protein